MVKFINDDVEILMEAHFNDHEVLLCKVVHKPELVEYIVWDYYPRGLENGAYFMNSLNAAKLEFLGRCEFLK